MSTHKKIDRICIAALVIAMIVTVIFMHAEQFGVTAVTTNGYEQRLFDTSRVHTIDIVMDDWDGFLETCENEEYTVCALVIDGEAYRNVAIRAKGNTSLSAVSQLGSSRYSFKLEFDHYNSALNYYGLDKLCLNNIIQDTTYMKDYLSYQLMAQMDVPSPLCSYAYITVNGEDWGLYLAVEGLEDGFLERNYGSDIGALYKPDSQKMGGGRGDEKNFDKKDFDKKDFDEKDFGETDSNEKNFDGKDLNSEAFEPPQMPSSDSENEKLSQPPQQEINAEAQDTKRPQMPQNGEKPQGGFGDGKGGMGSDDVKLKYIDDALDSYENIFDNAKTKVSKTDKKRLIASLKALSEGTDIEAVVDTDEVIRYFVVHNFLCNDDSYTGSMVHNYYLYEKNGKLSMLPWDYNLAFGTFQGSNATDTVNAPIDSPVSGGSLEDRPMVAWIFADEEYTQLYHQYFGEFLEKTDFAQMIQTTKALIAPYVEKDPTKFYTYEQFETGVDALQQFCALRTKSIEGQLDGTIPSTSDGQQADAANLIDVAELTLSDMGSMNDTMSDRAHAWKNGAKEEKEHGQENAHMPDASALSAPAEQTEPAP